MELNAIFDVAISLAFTFFLLSVIASGLQEFMAGLFRWRGTYLAKSIDVIMDNGDATRFAWNGLGDWLRAHLTRAPAELPRRQREETNPILARIRKGMSSHPLLRGTPADLPSYVPARNFSMALLEVLRDGVSGTPLFAQVEQTVAEMPEGDLKRTLGVFLHDAAGDIDRFRVNLERWFDDAMDRASGIYKRLSQYVTLVFGLLLAISLNIDTLHVARTLWDEPVSRAALVAGAAVASERGGVTDPGQQLQTTLQALRCQPLPLGWELDKAEPACRLPGLAPHHHRPAWPRDIPGWLLTALAVSLGAPFWFELLQNLINLRAAGPKPDRSIAG